MYAVIETGGKQYRVRPGKVIQVEKIEGEKGASVVFDKVLLVGAQSKDSETEGCDVWVGQPYLKSAKVAAQIVGQGRGEKIVMHKMTRRKGYHRTQGHRQYYTQVMVTSLENGSGKSETLNAEQIKSLSVKFHSHLRPKGAAFTPKKIRPKHLQMKDATVGETPAKSPKQATKGKTAGKKGK